MKLPCLSKCAAKIEFDSHRIFSSGFKASKLIALFGALAVFVFMGVRATAQTVEFNGTQRPVALGFYEPESIAADQYGDLFVADADTFKISEILAVNGTIPANPTIRTLFRDSYNPEGIAVDRNGNVFFGDYNDLSTNGQCVNEIQAINGQIPSSPTVVQLACGFTFPQGVSVDASGDVFVADPYKHSVFEILAVNGSVPPSPTILSLGSGFSGPRGVAVDALGDVFVADGLNHAVKEVLAVGGSIPANPTIVTLTADYGGCPTGVSFDSQGNLYFSDGCYDAVYEILAQNGTIPTAPAVKLISSGKGLSSVSDVAVDGNENIYVGGAYAGTEIPQVYPSDFGSVTVGANSEPTPLLFTFWNNVTIGSISVVTDGAADMDFADAGMGTCTPGTSYSVDQICTVDVTLKPTFAGVRSGAVIIRDTNGNVVGVGYTHGTGVAPQLNLAPPMQNTAVSIPSAANDVAVDASGNLYLAATEQNQILKETLTGGTYVQSVIPTSPLNAPEGVAVDSAGNIYIADTGNARILKETPSATGYSEATIGIGVPVTPVGIAVDESGNVYAACEDGSLFFNWSYGGDGLASTGMPSASGVAVDKEGNVYVVSGGATASVVKEMRSGSGYAISGTIPLPSGIVPARISVDAFGNLYVSYTDGSGVGHVLKETPSSGGYVASLLDTSGLNLPLGLAVDQSGNLFIADSGNARIVEEDYADAPSLSFASTPFGSTSADSPQRVTLTNIGNANLTFPIPASGNNPSISASFTLDDSAPSACPVIGSAYSAPGILAAGTSCDLNISFAPAAVGDVSGSLMLTDNNLNASVPGYASQRIALSGTSVPATPTITWAQPAAITYGTALSATQLDATASVPGTFSYSPAAGTELSVGTHTLQATFTPTDTTDYTTATASVTLTVNQATPLLTWPTPAPIDYGTALSSMQLDATANVPGTFVYSPAAGNVPQAGTDTLSVTFTPTDATDYTTATAQVTLTVNNPSFTLSASPASLSIARRGSGSTVISVAGAGGFSGSVTLAVSNLPRGVTAAFGSNSIIGTTSLTFYAARNAAKGTTSVLITGESGFLNGYTTISLTIVK